LETSIDTEELHQIEDLARTSEAARILLVEEDPRAALLFGEMLRATWVNGLVLAHTEILKDAVQELTDRGASCVLLDLSLPGVDELGSIEQIRSAAPEVAIVVLTERGDEQQAMHAIRAGAQDYVVKSELYPARLARSVRYAIERKRFETRLARLALHDPLTGLPNRALFLDRLTVALDRARRTNASIAVLFLDVDHFKQINDTLGHGAGDRLLKELAGRLRSMLRPMDTVARFGGDEFTFLFEELTSEREVLLITERITHAAKVPVRLPEAETQVTVSIGIAMVEDPSIGAEAVIREADAAMYRAKELGRARYELFDDASRQRATERVELESALTRALERSELTIEYQPRISLDGGPPLIGFEALIRWVHPRRGLIAPREFIPVAEDTGLVIAIGQYVLERALGQLAQWRRVQPHLSVSVNLSLRQLEDAGLASMVAGAIRASDVDPRALCLEVAERNVTRHPEIALHALEGLKTAGVCIAIDDYGTGAASLSSLKRLPVDVLKIHESFIAGIGHTPQDASIVAAVVELGHALGLQVVAEGVETDAQLSQLRELGCDGAQGFLLGRPLPENEVAALLAH
jgi:diguanylate cyclase (GGDEF)-like protein